ncbi:hypothetical protein BH20VER3_BH20VER3_18720 [soil metagenome]
MTNPERILAALDARLDAPVELTLYGRAALLLGFENPPPEFALSRDVDAVMWMGQAEELAQRTNFWDVVAAVNQEFRDQELFISHFFEEDQVVLTPDWRNHRILLGGRWTRLTLYRLGNADLFLSKLMRDDPIDAADARFIVHRILQGCDSEGDRFSKSAADYRNRRAVQNLRGTVSLA